MSSPWRKWLPVVVWVTVIYTTIPFVRALREWYVARWDPVWIGLAVASVIVGAAITTLILLSRRTPRVSPGRAAWITGVTVIFLAWTFSLRRSPEESIHFLEYGILAVLLHRALRPSVPNALVFVAAALTGALIGTVDEVIQWISPGRYWDWRDLALNGGAGALTQFVLWRFSAPFTDPIDPASRRLVLRLGVAQLVLVTLCLANTPARVERYATRWPSTAYLTSSRNPMAEYGHRITKPGLGAFSSRLTLEELRRHDEDRGIEVAGLVDDNRRRYGKFLDTWPVSEDPFTYEARVHLFARNRNLTKAMEVDLEGAAARAQLSVAWFENRIVEEFFGNTLEHSSFIWNPPIRKRIEAAHDPNLVFESAAGSHLITFVSERTLRMALFVLMAVMIVADLRIGRSHRRHP